MFCVFEVVSEVASEMRAPNQIQLKGMEEMVDGCVVDGGCAAIRRIFCDGDTATIEANTICHKGKRRCREKEIGLLRPV